MESLAWGFCQEKVGGVKPPIWGIRLGCQEIARGVVGGCYPCSTSSPFPETAHEPPPRSTTNGHSSAPRAPFWPLHCASAVACAGVAAAPGRLGMPLSRGASEGGSN